MAPLERSIFPLSPFFWVFHGKMNGFYKISIWFIWKPKDQKLFLLIKIYINYRNNLDMNCSRDFMSDVPWYRCGPSIVLVRRRKEGNPLVSFWRVEPAQLARACSLGEGEGERDSTRSSAHPRYGPRARRREGEGWQRRRTQRATAWSRSCQRGHSTTAAATGSANTGAARG